MKSIIYEQNGQVKRSIKRIIAVVLIFLVLFFIFKFKR